MELLRARLCSQNAHKLRELRAALPGVRLTLLGARGFPEEEGESYYENARAKAAFARAVGPGDEWMLGEDSGVEVAALGFGPGVRSNRWAEGEDANAKLRRRLAGVPDRSARYVCELVALAPDGEEVRGTGVLTGRIADAARGSGGFGYDPIFIPDGETRTVAELGNAWKTANSHRARAAHALHEALRAASATS